MGLCTSCGHPAVASERFCIACGAAVAAAGPPAAVSGQFAAPRDPYGYLYASAPKRADTSLLPARPPVAEPMLRHAAVPPPPRAPRPGAEPMLSHVAGQRRAPLQPSDAAHIIVCAASAVLA